MKRKFGAVLILLSLVTALTACGGEPAPAETTAASPAATTVATTAPETTQATTFVDAEGHVWADVEGDKVCLDCGIYKNSVENEDWHLPTVPLYTAGKLVYGVYNSGYVMMSRDFTPETRTEMMSVTETTLEEYLAYCQRLESLDYEVVSKGSRDELSYAEYACDEGILYTYYVLSKKEIKDYSTGGVYYEEESFVRIILDRISDRTTDLSYEYTAKDGESTEVYQYGLNSNSNGMLYFVKLPDNSLIIVDAGSTKHSDPHEVMSFMREITDTPEDGSVRVAAWFVTHLHGDHTYGMTAVVKNYSDSIDFERVLYNFPTNEQKEYDNPDFTMYGNVHDRFIEIMSYVSQDEPCYVKLHTGQTFDLGGVTLEVLYTHEDIVSRRGVANINKDFNNSSTVAMITFEGKKFLVTGDINSEGSAIVTANTSDQTLSCDIIQIAHHGYNDVSDIFTDAAAPIVFVPGTKKNAVTYDFYELYTSFAEEGMVFYQNEGTVGFAVENGELVPITR